MRILGIVFSVLAMFIFAKPAFAAMGSAMIHGTAADSKIAGEARFTEKDGGLEAEINIVNAPPGKHGFHIHENGSCDDMGKAAGGHYNPDGVMHGMVVKDGFAHAHAGDFGNIEIGEDGTGTLTAFIPGLTLTGEKYKVSGKAVILHEKEDDFGQPLGNAGGRIGCGIIVVADRIEVPEGAEGWGDDEVGEIIAGQEEGVSETVTATMEPMPETK